VSRPDIADDSVEAEIVVGGARWPRRQVLKAIAALGVGSAVFHRALAALAEQSPEITPKMIRQAEWISNLEFTKDERRLMLEDLGDLLAHFEKIRAVPLDNAVSPALLFDPVPLAPEEARTRGTMATVEVGSARRPDSPDDLAFASVRELAGLIRSRQVSSVELTRLYLERMSRFDPALHCVITRTEKLALEQAERADREIASGDYRGPLHGLPWGVKDLFSVPGYRTTWGATPFKDQVRQEKATVVARLEEAGAPLLAKLSVGALAWGDVWFDAMTRNPWNTEEGSSGSSAGSASATAAGLVAFAIGTETWGSIVSPCTRCGVTGLRPTFGRVSRHGGMALSWSMDKVGPIARTVDDCALVFQAVHGADGLDPTAVDRPFEWKPDRDVRSLKVGFVESLFEEDRSAEIDNGELKARVREWQEHDRRALEVLRDLGVDLVPIELPDNYPIEALSLILRAEASAAFDELTRSGKADLLVRQERNAWPNVFRWAQLIPAVEYIRANRIRTLVMQELERTLADVDAYVSPSYGGNNLLLTNLTGHPAVVLPHGFSSTDGTPTSITIMGRLFGEAEALTVAHAYQRATDFHLQRPPVKEHDSEE
jgi:Asp-tRNA(Asn)/Glu-tRNA(Gln) amidotransferase A subunit family amidase